MQAPLQLRGQALCCATRDAARAHEGGRRDFDGGAFRAAK